MWRKAAAVLVGLGAVTALDSLVLTPWRCNTVEGQVARSIDSVWEIRHTYRARRVAEEALPLLITSADSCPTNVNLWMLTGSALSILERWDVAVQAYRSALRFDRRPELYMALGLAQLQAGAPKNDAISSLVTAAEFSGTDILKEVPDAEARWAAYSIVGARDEKNLAEKGLLDKRNQLNNADFSEPAYRTAVARTTLQTAPSAASSWEIFNEQPGLEVMTRLVPSDRSAGMALHVIAKGEHSGIFQRFEAPVARVTTSAWIRVVRGSVYIGSSNGNKPWANAYSAPGNDWQRLSGLNVTCPAHITVVYAASAEGAEFYIDEISAIETAIAPPCES